MNLKNIATITFPDTPKIISQPNTMYSLDRASKINRSGLYYQAQTFPVKKSLIDMFNTHLLDTFYNYTVMGMLKATDGRLLYKKNIAFNKIRGIEFGYKGNVKLKQFYYGYFQAFYFNNTMICNEVLSYDSLQSDNRELKAFFSTFKPSIKDKDIDQPKASDLARIMRYVFGIIAIICLTGGIIIFVIKKIASKINE